VDDKGYTVVEQEKEDTEMVEEDPRGGEPQTKEATPEKGV